MEKDKGKLQRPPEDEDVDIWGGIPSYGEQTQGAAPRSQSVKLSWDTIKELFHTRVPDSLFNPPRPATRSGGVKQSMRPADKQAIRPAESSSGRPATASASGLTANRSYPELEPQREPTLAMFSGARPATAESSVTVSAPLTGSIGPTGFTFHLNPQASGGLPPARLMPVGATAG